MLKKRGLLQELAERTDLPTEAVPGLTVAELWGKNRVLVENHNGVLEYEREKILIKASYGRLKIMGRDLHLNLMTGEQVIISGTISGMTVEGV